MDFVTAMDHHPKKLLFIISILFIVYTANGKDNTVAGALHIEPPTLICLGFDWRPATTAITTSMPALSTSMSATICSWDLWRILRKDTGSRVDYNTVRAGIRGTGLYCLQTQKERICTSTHAEFSEKTGYQENGVGIRDYDIFVSTREPGHAPTNRGKLYRPANVDLRPEPGAPVVDAGCIIPGINDDFKGKAPDIGAYEQGEQPPRYGPRVMN